MKQVFDHIKERCRSFDQKPLFAYLRNPQLAPRERLKFVPNVAHFVMTFADLYHFFLTENPPRDHYQELVNTHLGEEGSHWKWFLRDLTAMDLDPTLRLTDALRFIWSDATVKTRALAYEMCKLSSGLSSVQKLAMVLAIEATGRVALEAAVPAGRAVEATEKGRLIYFGQHHLDTERKHTVEDRDVHRSLEEIPLPESELPELYAIVDKVFYHFGEFIDETFELARSGRGVAEIAAAEQSRELTLQ